MNSERITGTSNRQPCRIVGNGPVEEMLEGVLSLESRHLSRVNACMLIDAMDARCSVVAAVMTVAIQGIIGYSIPATPVVMMLATVQHLPEPDPMFLLF